MLRKATAYQEDGDPYLIAWGRPEAESLASENQPIRVQLIENDDDARVLREQLTVNGRQVKWDDMRGLQFELYAEISAPSLKTVTEYVQEMR